MTEELSAYDLVVVRGPRPGTGSPLPWGRVVVGRSSACDVRFDDPEVSARHLFLTVDATGVRLSDAGSTNGTHVAGVAVTTEVSLQPTQTIEIGAMVLSLELRTPPASASRASLPEPLGEWTLPIGVGSRDAVVNVDMSNGHLVVLGPYRSGRTETLRTLATKARMLEAPPALHLLAPRASHLVDGDWDSSVVGHDAVVGALHDAGRFLTRGDKALVVLDDADELLGDDHDEFERVLRAARNSPVRVAISAETKSAHRAFGGWFLEARKQRNAIVLQPDVANDGDLFGVALPQQPDRFEPGSGYLIEREALSAVQVATDPQDDS